MTVAWMYLDKKSATADAIKDYKNMQYIMNQHANTATNTEYSCYDASATNIDVFKQRLQLAISYLKWFSPAWHELSETERFVLTEFYLTEEKQIDAIEIICEQLHIERSSAYKRKNRALEHLSILLYGK